MAKGGAQWQDRLNALGTALSGYGSALTGNPMFLQSSLAMQQMQQQRREQEQQQRQSQAGDIALRSLIGGMQAPGTPATKAYEVNGRTIGQNREAAGGMNPGTQLGLLSKFAPGAVQSVVASQVMQQLFPQGFTGTLGEGEVAFQNGKQVATGPTKRVEGANKEGDTKDFIVGNQVVPHMYTGGKWVRMEGMGGPRWEAQKPPQKPYGYDEEQARKAEEAARKSRADEYSFQSTDEGFSDIIRKAAQLGTNPNLASYTGTYDALTPNFSGGAKQFQADLDVLKSNLAMNALNAAKAASASGATGFGALSEGELKILQNQIATLDPSVGPENFQRQIVDIINKTKKMQGALRSTRPANAPAPSTKSAIPGFKIEPLD